MLFGKPTMRGFTLLELLIAMALAAMLLAAISSFISSTIGSETVSLERNQLRKEARFALQRMNRAVSESTYLFVPQPDKPATNWRENVREETVPASPPEGDSSKATAVLAIALSASVDLDADGFPDVDNDRDGRINEDYPADIANDFDPGIHLIDDGGDGLVDEGFLVDWDDDESANTADEDALNGADDDGDGFTDEDPGADMNGDGAPGLAGVDDDGDGQVDEGSDSDDDEDGAVDEDWLDAVVYYLQDNTLIERHPVPWDETANGQVTGRDFVESEIASSVTRFRVERPAPGATGEQLIVLTLELTSSSGDVISLTSRVRVGGAL